MARKKSEEPAEVVDPTTGEVLTPPPPPVPVVHLPKGKDAQAQIGKLLANEVVQGLFKTYGTRSLIEGAEVKARRTHRIPTGVFPLDVALNGGWATGGIHTLYGHKYSGKTTTLYRSLGEAQKLCAECWEPQAECKCGKLRDPVIAYIDVEGALDAPWASRFCDLAKMLVSHPEYAEQAISIAEALLRSHHCDIIVMDSIAFLTPAKEITEATEKDQVGEQARRLGKGVRKFVAALNEAMTSTGRRPTLFFTNQIRMKVGVMFGNPETTSGGLAPGFAAWTEVKMKPAKYKLDEKDEMALWGDFSFTVDKAKNSAPKTSFDYRMMLVDTETKRLGDIYDEDFILDHASRHSLVSGGGASWTCLGEKFGKKTEIEDRLLRDKAFRRRVTQALLAAVQPQP